MVAAGPFFITLFAVAAYALPAQQHYTWISDGQGHLHLVDLLEDAPIPAAFDGATDVTLSLYTQSNPGSPQFITINNIPSVFNANNPTRFIIHGWESNALNMDQFRSAYMLSGSYNVILVDWSKLASTDYTSAKSSAIQVGKYIAQVVNNLVSIRDLNVNTLYIIGHDLGAHASGVAGYNLDAKLASVVGLDPNSVLFITESLENRIDASDAVFVQVIHTNIGGLGWSNSEALIGDADYYVNGGKRQPGCGIDLTGACNHGRSFEYYVESISSKRFIAHGCVWCTAPASCPVITIMGEHCSHSACGCYCLNTYYNSPYAQG